MNQINSCKLHGRALEVSVGVIFLFIVRTTEFWVHRLVPNYKILMSGWIKGVFSLDEKYSLPTSSQQQNSF